VIRSYQGAEVRVEASPELIGVGTSSAAHRRLSVRGRLPRLRRADAGDQAVRQRHDPEPMFGTTK